MDEWLRTPESDAPVPDFVERDLEKPFEIDLSEWAAVELSPDFAERVVRALAKKRDREATLEKAATPATEGGAPAKGNNGPIKPGPKAASPGKRTPEDPPRPALAHARPAERRVTASRR